MKLDLGEGDFDAGDGGGMKLTERGTNPDDKLLELATAFFTTIAEAEHVKALLAMFSSSKYNNNLNKEKKTMGNCLALPLLKEDDQVLQVIKMDDGKIMEFKNPLLVKDLLVNYPSSYVGAFKEAKHPLPLEHKLKIGKIYYLLPRAGSDDDHEEHRKIEAPAKRIKVVITKAQLQQLIAKQRADLKSSSSQSLHPSLK
ncbi:hypothetical protein Cgig2_016034 [Carnegiea gigantea]|uniref:Uncharacterized protein n=1 Tax=Carnegiea gigantea TaxID=171969 RepID=A0A9Q1QKP6_9CARY|nr:hypothetical protein Cgig2_016034 [Carnegiea gigantea]